jgi:hypothetical protein
MPLHFHLPGTAKRQSPLRGSQSGRCVFRGSQSGIHIFQGSQNEINPGLFIKFLEGVAELHGEVKIGNTFKELEEKAASSEILRAAKWRWRNHGAQTQRRDAVMSIRRSRQHAAAWGARSRAR